MVEGQGGQRVEREEARLVGVVGASQRPAAVPNQEGHAYGVPARIPLRIGVHADQALNGDRQPVSSCTSRAVAASTVSP